MPTSGGTGLENINGILGFSHSISSSASPYVSASFSSAAGELYSPQILHSPSSSQDRNSRESSD